ncbi:glycosyltransferase family 2 protein [Providencia stuartii]|uniref:glycosyltransferase family 2 protein n=1 Tax=Providencia stuartii TaxID=588 RepID=UPI0033294FCB
MPKVSVILPVYNAEKYIKRSLFSLLNQTLNDIQIIIIDDGSTDNSLTIINNILKQNSIYKSKVTLISRGNKGVAATRAEGINIASGDYIIQCDSDDWVDKDWLKLLYDTACKNNSDIVICDYIDVYKNKNHIVSQKCFPSTKQNIESLLTNNISNMNWDKLIKRSIVIENEINYIQNVDMGEDFLFSLKSFYYAKKISHIPKALYYYNKTNQNSLTYKYSDKSLADIINVTKEAERFLIDRNYLNTVKESFDLFKLNVKVSSIVRSSGKLYDINKGMNLYPEINYLVTSTHAPKILKIWGCPR